MLKPQDLVVLLKLLALEPGEPWTFASLAGSLSMSPSQVHAALRRAAAAGLYVPALRQPNRTALAEFLVHGLRYVFWPERGPVTRGIPTGHSAPPLSELVAGEGSLPTVWPTPLGDVQGEALKPHFRSVPEAALADRRLYRLLALVDGLRAGRARERRLAREALEAQLAA